MTQHEKRRAEQTELLTEMKTTLTQEGLECWGPDNPWGVVIFPYNGQECVLSITPASFYGWLVSLQYHRGSNGTGCSCNPGNAHEGITTINKAVLQECAQRGLGFASTLKGVKLHTKESYLKENPDYVLFKVK